MALDGITLLHIRKELEKKTIGSRIDKIYQPSKEEIILGLRNQKEHMKLLLCSSANNPRIHLTNYSIENPKTPPMLCMLLRKKLMGAKIISYVQPKLERILFVNLESRNELGDLVTFKIVLEIMGKHSNIILIDKDDIIVESAKRVDTWMSTKRLVLPGIKYEFPPSQDKQNLLDCSILDILNKMESSIKKQRLDKTLLDTVMGISPVVCREIAYRVNRYENLYLVDLDNDQQQILKNEIIKLISTAIKANGTPYIVLNQNNKPIEFSFMKITQYNDLVKIYQCNNFSEMLDKFYFERARIDRIKSKTQSINKLILNIRDRLNRKISNQTIELSNSENRDQYRIFGDLLKSNLHSIEKGQNLIEIMNFYDDMKPVKIKLNPALSPIQNAQKYYKIYKKAATAREVLTKEIEKSRVDLLYLETVLDALGRVKTEDEISEIRDELCKQSYLKSQGKTSKVKQQKKLESIEVISAEGYKILIGRNNYQNDYLTLKKAGKEDVWFHTKNIPGSHVVVFCNRNDLSDKTIMEAANLAAIHSSAKDSSNVPVDYTAVKNIKKPPGAKPGMVIYENYKTIYITPKHEI